MPIAAASTASRSRLMCQLVRTPAEHKKHFCTQPGQPKRRGYNFVSRWASTAQKRAEFAAIRCCRPQAVSGEKHTKEHKAGLQILAPMQMGSSSMLPHTASLSPRSSNPQRLKASHRDLS